MPDEKRKRQDDDQPTERDVGRLEDEGGITRYEAANHVPDSEEKDVIRRPPKKE